MINKERMKLKAEGFGIALSEIQLQQLDQYADMLVDWNSRMNLTAIVDPDEIETKHFLDCLLAAKLCKAGDKIADVGTGAGFPGVVMKIFCPEAEVTLIDSLEKRLSFLSNVGSELGLKMQCIHGRAEDIGHIGGLRQAFSVTTARAVAPMNVLAEFCLPLTAVGGRLIAMKGRIADDELKTAANAIEILGGSIEDEQSFVLPDADHSERQLTVVRKTAETPEKYPRRAPVIKKKPL